MKQTWNQGPQHTAAVVGGILPDQQDHFQQTSMQEIPEEVCESLPEDTVARLTSDSCWPVRMQYSANVTNSGKD